MSGRIGWVLIHRKPYQKEETGPKDFASGDDLKNRLRLVWESNQLWHWKRSYPLKEGGPYTILFGFDEKIWADARAEITHRISKDVPRKDFNFAFRILEQPSVVPNDNGILLQHVVGRSYLRHHRDLMVLDPEMVGRYHKLKNAV